MENKPGQDFNYEELEKRVLLDSARKLKELVVMVEDKTTVEELALMEEKDLWEIRHKLTRVVRGIDRELTSLEVLYISKGRA